MTWSYIPNIDRGPYKLYTYAKQATFIDFWGPLGHRAAWHHQDGNGLDPAESAAGMKKRAIGDHGGFMGKSSIRKLGT